MRTQFAASIAIALLLASSAVTARVQDKSEAALKAAIDKEVLSGDLKGAIEQYKKLAESKDRTVAVRALIRMADCYRKLGDAESRKIYERIVRDFSDQKDAVATARTRLGDPAAQNAGVVTRQLWTGSNVDVYGSVSPDGRFISFTDWDTGELALHDLTTGKDRLLTNKGGWDGSLEYALGAAISRDGKQVAYGWTISTVRPGESTWSEIRVVEMNAGKPRVVISSRTTANRDVTGMWPHDWSPDDKWLAVSLGRQDGTAAVALLSTTDGALRILKSVNDCRPTLQCFSKLAFSPDGKYVAYDHAGNADSRQRGLHLLPIDGSAETSLLPGAVNDRVLGWSPDGKRLLFASNRSGLSGIWALPVTAGKADGEPQLVRANINPTSLGIARSGALYYGVGNPSRDVYTASIDFDAGKVLSAPAIIPKQYIGLNDFPVWSSDGKLLAYLSLKDSNSRNTQLNILMIRSLESGQVREFRPDLLYLDYSNFRPLWIPDGSALIVNAVNKTGQQGIYRVDAQTGETKSIIMSERSQGDSIARGISPDGKTLYISRSPTVARTTQAEEVIVAHDMSSGREREVARRKDQWGRGFDLSPDGRWFAITAVDPATKQTYLLMYPTDGGAVRELVHFSRPQVVVGAFTKFSPDGKSILFAKGQDNPTPRELWKISIDGGDARKINLNADWAANLAESGTTSRSFHPDGHQVAFAKGRNQVEIWVLENFLKVQK